MHVDAFNVSPATDLAALKIGAKPRSEVMERKPKNYLGGMFGME